MSQVTTLAYSPTLDIRNVQALPRGTGARYLLCIKGLEEGVLIAKRWCRKKPVTLFYGEVLVDFKEDKS